MLIYYFGLSFIFVFFLMVVFFLFQFKKYTKLQWLYISIMLIISSSVMGLGYYYFGATTALRSLYAYREIHNVLSSLQVKNNTSPEFVEEELTRLYQRLPQDEQVHAKMGEVYLALNLPIKAENAYQRALKIRPLVRDYAYGFYYAQSLHFHGVLPVSSVQALIKLTEQFPKDNGLLNLLAVNSFQTKQYSRAIEYWEKIRSEDLEEARLLQEMIARAKAGLNQGV
jgi:cytochrome c-type biogenesis protein CcmH/NrfG